MRRISLTLLLLLSTSALRAQDAKPNTLTPKEIADGWILLFDGETTFGWKQAPNVGWIAKNGELVFEGKNAAPLVSTTELGNYDLNFEFQSIKNNDQVLVACPSTVQALTLGDDGNWPRDRKVEVCGLSSLGAGWHRMHISVVHGRIYGCSITALHSGRMMFPEETLGNPTSKSPVPGHLAFAGQSGLQLRNVKIRPNASVSLFTGADLTGWKIFPGKKSEFSVKDGAIHMKNGPGDLQTEKQFGDFCLQLECKSNGPHLNSGVFFRCRPGEYQNGYECQIRNQFTEKPTQKYLIEEYDPQTHKLLRKKEAFYTAVDYGTGAIYRRQPARKEVAKDNEWFALTIVAHGNHFATWVNGIQVADWTDNRPPSDNARTGFRREAGHISLQGHDPTTDLSFRNFRIQEYPK